ncbi:TPA: hypothetical protein N0F65_010603 [Lagenidium giganteum]|uniref:Leucine-rich repeat domain, L domain-like n=1 Tax=Lagenidium giganteum TaxID=4803 RepID=A0AAV2ZII8_9STRA|nr:TPA: hypothetical protein N0F65_010603 [Lagenidium giganteum]
MYSFILTIRNPNDVTVVLRNFGTEHRVWVLELATVVAIGVALFHTSVIVRTLVCSVRQRQLTFVHTVRDTHSHPESFEPTSAQLQAMFMPVRLFWRFMLFIRRWQFLCSIRGPYFEVAFHVRETFELVWQTAQAYRVSFFINHVWVNQLAVAVLVLNCWTTPLIFFLFPKKQALRRVLCMAVDIGLDMASSMGIPLSVFLTYRKLRQTTDWYDPVWAITAGYDLLQVITNTWIDVLSRGIPMVSMVLHLAAIEPMLRPNDRMHHATLFRSRRVSGHPTGIVPGRVIVKPFPRQTRLITRVINKARTAHLHVLNVCFIIYGIVVVVVFALANQRVYTEQVSGCAMTMRQWLAVDYPCAIMEIDCSQYEIDGTRTQLATILDDLDRQALAVLVLSHCPAIDVPPTIQEFQNLVWLEIFNSTIVNWDLDAAFTKAKSSYMSRLMIVHTNFIQSFPPALTVAGFPPTLCVIEIVGTNLTTIPDSVASTWPRPMYKLHLERNQFKTVPSALSVMDITFLSLAGNSIASLPVSLLDNEEFVVLSLADTAIDSLPDTGVQGSVMRPPALSEQNLSMRVNKTRALYGIRGPYRHFGSKNPFRSVPELVDILQQCPSLK